MIDSRFDLLLFANDNIAQFDADYSERIFFIDSQNRLRFVALSSIMPAIDFSDLSGSLANAQVPDGELAVAKLTSVSDGFLKFTGSTPVVGSIGINDVLQVDYRAIVGALDSTKKFLIEGADNLPNYQQYIASADIASLDGAKLQDGTTTIAKLSSSGASSGDAITFNGSAIVWAPAGVSDVTVNDLADLVGAADRTLFQWRTGTSSWSLDVAHVSPANVDGSTSQG